MVYIFRALIALALAAAAAGAYADPPGRVARLNYASGAVSFAPGEAPGEWLQAMLNRPLTGGDRLWADRDGRAELHVGSTAVRMAALTNLDILYLDDDRLQLRLAQGTANVRVRELDADDVVEIATPAGAVLLRQPGSYRISADPHSDTTRVVVSFGEAEIVTTAQRFVVPTGQIAVIPAGGPPAFEIAASGDEFDRWSAERDRREDRVESRQYVSSQMTGYEDLDGHGSWRTVPEYGAVWTPARVAPGWAPYRHGHWAWVSPWGWTWIDDAPWGFAPFHYGRWVRVHDHWAWAPGPIVRRPVYAPALVVFVGGAGWSVASGPAVGWFPLGWREPYRPWYRASHRHVQNVNVTNVTNLTNINVTHVHRSRPEAVTVVSRQSFVSARPVAVSRVAVAPAELARAEVVREQSPAQPVRASLASAPAGQRPPREAAAREVVAVNAVAPQTARELPGIRDRSNVVTRGADAAPPVRVVDRENVDARQRDRAARQARQAERAAPSASAPTLTPAPQAPPAAAPAVTAAPAAAPTSASAPRVAVSRPTPAAPPPPAQPAAAASAPPARAVERERRERVEQRARAEHEPAEQRARTEQRERVEAQQRTEAQRQRLEQPRERAQPRVEAPTSRAAPAPRTAPAATPAPQAVSAPAPAPAPRAQQSRAQPPSQDSGSRRERPQREGGSRFPG